MFKSNLIAIKFSGKLFKYLIAIKFDRNQTKLKNHLKNKYLIAIKFSGKIFK